MDNEKRIYPGADGLLPGGLPGGLYDAALSFRGGPPDQPPIGQRLRLFNGFWSNESGGDVSPRYDILWVCRIGD
jgi:hypothetical protein